MTEQKEIIDRGRNIKCFDKIKLSHNHTGFRLHSVDFQLKSGSYNQAVTTHKQRDETDWFVVLFAEPSQNNSSNYIQYNDKILLSNCKTKKYIHVSTDYDSPISHNYEVSLCQNGNGGVSCIEDEWILEVADKGQDEYWRVGECIRLKNINSDAYLASSKKRMKQNGDNQVCCMKDVPKDKVQKIQKGNPKGDKNEKQREKERQEAARQKLKNQQQFWLVSEIEPFIYTANISSKRINKKNQENQQFQKLTNIKKQLPRKKAKKVDQIGQILKIQNQRMEQLENQRKKIQEFQKKNKCWRKYLCCLCLSNDDYDKLD